jgi:hypothetical protein
VGHSFAGDRVEECRWAPGNVAGIGSARKSYVREKEVVHMQELNGQSKRHRILCGNAVGCLEKESPPAGDLEERCVEWGGEFRSILKSGESPLTMRYGRTRTRWIQDAEPRSDKENRLHDARGRA